MKTHDFARQLELLAKFLRSLPNTEFSESLKRSVWSDGLIKEDAIQSVLLDSPLLPANIEEQLRKMSPAEIEIYLKSESNPFTSSQLITLAEKLGISTSKRQNKEALINAIARYFEAGQMDTMIRSTRKDES